MNSKNSKLLYARRILMLTGLFPTIPCWIVYLGSSTDVYKESLLLTVALVGATILSSVIAYPFRKKNLDWIYNERPVFGSFVSMAVHMAAGFTALVSPFAIYFLVLGDVSAAAMCLVYASVAMLIALPGAVLGFYANAHALIYLAQKSFILKSNEN